MIFTEQCGSRIQHPVKGLVLLAAVVLLAVVASGTVKADAAVSGVRGAVLELFANKGDGTPIGQLSRAEGRALKSNPAPILVADGDWLQILYTDKKYWVRAEQARETGDRPALSCGAQLGGSSAGATRGIGEGCK